VSIDQTNLLKQVNQFKLTVPISLLQQVAAGITNADLCLDWLDSHRKHLLLSKAC
jgi:hypothetical protein